MSERTSEDTLERISEKMLDTMLDVCYGSQGKCMLVKTDTLL